MSVILEEIGKEKALVMYRKMVTIRKFEERVRYLFLEGIMPGTIHQCDGQEASAVGVCSVLGEGDTIGSTHRPHGHAIARGLGCRELMAELFGKTTGCCRGKGGSMHIGDLEKGMLPAIAITGANIPIVAGMGLAFRIKRKKSIAVSFFGDGSSNEGAFHEGINLASVYDLPCIFVCENNLYGASTPVSMVVKAESIAARGCAYGIEGVVADGNDVLEVYREAKRLAEKARAGGGPSILELRTYRRCGHSRRDAREYMDKEEMKFWMDKDPLVIYGNKLKDFGYVNDDEIVMIGKEVDDEIEEAVVFAQNSPDPEPEDALQDVFV